MMNESELFLSLEEASAPADRGESARYTNFGVPVTEVRADESPQSARGNVE